MSSSPPSTVPRPSAVEETPARPGASAATVDNENGGAKRGLLQSGSRFRKFLPLVVLVVIAAGVAAYLLTRGWESTDDAEVDGHIYTISSRITGHVTHVDVENGTFVKAGTLLVEIDPVPFQTALQKAQATYEQEVANAKVAGLTIPVSAAQSQNEISNAQSEVANAEAGLNAAQKQVDEAQARLVSAQASARKANSDVQRYSQLADKKEISQQQYEQAQATADSANAAVSAAEAALRTSHAQVQQAQAKLAQAQSQVGVAQTGPQQVAATRQKAQSASATMAQAKAQLDQAQLELSYTKIVAPVDGEVGSRSVQVGQNVSAGQALLAVVPLNDLWVTANFKETQLRNMVPGQPAKIDVDAYGTTLDGHLASIGAATGARFSLLPPENATGNYVKVVQRVPVRIEFNKGVNTERLRPGMSVVVKVHVD